MKSKRKKGKDTLAGVEAHFFGREQLAMTAREVGNSLVAKSNPNLRKNYQIWLYPYTFLLIDF